jgi:1,4-dihydroxy-2-naphthoate octaprenyltransferase
MQITVAIRTMRPSFLILTPICVFLGLSSSIAYQSTIDSLMFFIVLIGATFAHISVNTLNEYFDFKSGLDLKTDKTQFSGGSGALPDCPDMARIVLIIGLISLIITTVIGFYLIHQNGTLILPIGITGILLIATYTQYLNRSPILCLISPGLGFGILMVVGTNVILTSEQTLLPWLVSLVPFFLINNLLLLNQYPDIKADSSVGRNTFPNAFGIKKSNLVYATFMISAYSLIILLVLKGYIPTLSCIAILPIIFSLFSLAGMTKWTSNIGGHPRYMAANVAAATLTPLLLGISIIIG